MIAECISAGLAFCALCILVWFCYFAIKSLNDSEIGTNKGRQLQAQLDAHADEMQRLRFRLRRIEDKLGIKEGEDKGER